MEAAVENGRSGAWANKNGPLVAVFGGTRPTPGSEGYEEARALGRALALAGVGVMSGGYGGTMEGVSVGARAAGGQVVGVLCSVFDPLPCNGYLTDIVSTATLFERLERLIQLADGFAVLRGSMGTVAELALVMNMYRVDGQFRKPLVLVGRGWERVVATMVEELYVTGEERERLRIVGTADEAAEYLRAHITR